MKILNLYCGIGGNRKLWGDDHDVTAVELDTKIAAIYQELFPNDKVIIGDAHEYLKEYYNEFDFIWSSPPCQTHSRMRHNLGVNGKGFNPVYPDMKLYQEIIFLKHNFKGKWVVENVNPYYEPLIEPNVELDRHKFWCNFDIQKEKFVRPKLRKAQIPELQEAYGYDLSDYKLPNKRQVLRNCVLPDVGEHILDQAIVHEENLVKKANKYQELENAWNDFQKEDTVFFLRRCKEIIEGFEIPKRNRMS